MVTVLVGVLGLLLGAGIGGAVSLYVMHDIIYEANKRCDETLAALRLATAIKTRPSSGEK